MTVKHILRVFLIALLALVLVACGEDSNSDDSSTSGDTGGETTEQTNDTDTSDNADTDTDTDTDSSTGEDVVLAETIFTIDAAGGELTINYPTGWFVQEFNGSITISNSEAAVSSAELASGQLVGSVLMLPVQDLGIEDGASAETVLNTFTQSTVTIAEDATFTLDEIVTFDANGNNAVIQYGAGSDAAGVADIANLVVDLDGNFVLMSFLAPEGEIAGYDDTLRAIAGTTTYQILEAEG